MHAVSWQGDYGVLTRSQRYILKNRSVQIVRKPTHSYTVLPRGVIVVFCVLCSVECITEAETDGNSNVSEVAYGHMSAGVRENSDSDGRCWLF